MYQFWNHILRPALTDLHPKTIVHIGKGSRELMNALVPNAKEIGAQVYTIDPAIRYDIASFSKRFPGVFRALDARVEDVMPQLASTDVVLMQGEPNWQSVTACLHAVSQASGSAEHFPTVFVSDVDWPYARRDGYLEPLSSTQPSMHPHAIAGVKPDQTLLVQGGGVFAGNRNALHEGGPRNGVRTAIEDFLRVHPNIQFHCIPGFCGLGVLHSSQAFTSLRTLLSSLAEETILTKQMRALESSRIELLSRIEDSTKIITAGETVRSRMHDIIEYYRSRVHVLEQDRSALMRSVSWRILMRLRYCFSSIQNLREAFQALRTPYSAIVRGFRFARAFLWPFSPGRVSFASGKVPQSSTTLSLKKTSPKVVVPVSVIVTARNSMPYLRECLLSILDQTVEPLEILFMDDGSTDGSIECAEAFPSVRVVQAPKRGVVVARNDAFTLTSGDFLLFLDGDDILTPSYIQEQVAALKTSPRAAFAYGTVSTFGSEYATYKAPPWSVAHMWLRNFVPTPSLLRRRAFEEVGGWRDTVGTLWDWDLFLRISRLYPGVPCDSRLLYRRHAASWSAMNEGTLDKKETDLLHGRLRRAVAKISICTVYGGRLPELLPLWAESIAKSVRAHHESLHAPEILILDTTMRGDESAIRKAFEPFKEIFSRITVVHRPEHIAFTSEMERRHKVSTLLARAYTTLLTLSEGDIMWFLEDDIVVPVDSYSVLMASLTDGSYDGSVALPPVDNLFAIPAAVSGLYRSRHSEEWIAYTLHEGNPVPVDIQGPKLLPIHLAGTGCLMILKPLVPPRLEPYWAGHITAHDWAWSQAIRDAGYEILLDPTVRCRHYHDASTFA